MREPAVPDSFGQWALKAKRPQPVSIDWPAPPPRRCIITVAIGYPPHVLRPLVLSWHRHCDAALIIIANEDNDLEQEFSGLGVIVHAVAKPAGYVPYPALARIDPYIDLLAAMPETVEQVLLVDSRDVVFQADPFAALPGDSLSFFAENDDPSSWRLSTINGRWAWLIFGRELRNLLIGRCTVNGGVIAGPPALLRRMCETKLIIALQTPEWSKHTTGLDNISTNVIAHTELAGPCRIHENHALVSNTTRESRASVNEAGDIVSPGGRVCPVVHMYDRHPALLAAVNRRYDVPQQRDLVMDPNRALVRPSWTGTLKYYLRLARIFVMGR
jgi:hypothetical protein